MGEAMKSLSKVSPDQGWLRFPGRAGELQDAGALRSLVSELAQNYDAYHAVLAAEMDAIGRIPDRADCKDAEEYLAIWDRLQYLGLAEAYLRSCLNHVEDGRPLTAAVDTSVPLADFDGGRVTLRSWRTRTSN